MPYTFNTPQDQREMLDTIGARSVEELFDSIPADLRLGRPLRLPGPLTEIELDQQMRDLASRNRHAGQDVCFLGGGCYDHFIPATVDALASRGEFYTSYTPYQAEVAQGNLQVMFEYQTLICQLTGMDVSNASLYDGGSATAEAVLMALSASRRQGNVLIPDSVHPEYRVVVDTYLTGLGTEVRTVPTVEGVVEPGAIQKMLSDQTACVVIQHPNFFGCLENVAEIAQLAHQAGAMLVQVFDPISLGVLKNPGQLGADIAVAEGQCLGNPMSYGGPYLGVLACRQALIRRVPGRIAGQTIASNNRRCWVLTLQTREQHIRRSKATSNICTNQGLFALRASIYLALMGPQGMVEIGHRCAQKAQYAADQLSATSRLKLAFGQPFFKEFVVRDNEGQVGTLLREAQAHGVMAGVALGQWYPQLEDCFLVAVTEKRTRQEIDKLVSSASGALAGAESIHA